MTIRKPTVRLNKPTENLMVQFALRNAEQEGRLALKQVE
jgi:hypothetical protein